MRAVVFNFELCLLASQPLLSLVTWSALLDDNETLSYNTEKIKLFLAVQFSYKDVWMSLTVKKQKLVV